MSVLIFLKDLPIPIIISQVKEFKNYNIVIESRITSRTDIYLSDCLLEKFNKEQIIWKNPPTPDDWEYFGNTIIREKNRHLTEKKSANIYG